jgi:ABC-type glycerol-3-phosphate transport system substrate-binding protein
MKKKFTVYSLQFTVKILCLVTGYWLLVTGLFGCAKKEDIAAKKTLTVWHWMTDREEAFTQLAKKYEAQTGIKVNFELYAPSDAYSQTVMTAAQGRALPDIYGLLGEKRIFAAFISAGHVEEMTPYLQENDASWQRRFFEKALAVNEFLQGNPYGISPGVYGIPIDVTNIQMVYNKDLFIQAGLDPNNPPDSWEEFLEAGDKLKAAGIPVLTSGWGETWLIDCFASNYAFNIMGQEKVIATIKGEIPYTSPDWIKVFELFDQLSRRQMLVGGIVTMGNKTAEQIFANSRAAFAFNGSWCVNVYREMNPELNYGAILPPAASDKFPMRIWGGAGSSFLVNARSPNKREAVEFLRWLTQTPQQVFLANETLNLPSNREAIKDIPPILAQFADDMDATTHPNTLPAQEYPRVIETLDKGIQAIIIGVKTPLEVAQEVQAIKEREMAK